MLFSNDALNYTINFTKRNSYKRKHQKIAKYSMRRRKKYNIIDLGRWTVNKKIQYIYCYLMRIWDKMLNGDLFENEASNCN